MQVGKTTTRDQPIEAHLQPVMVSFAISSISKTTPSRRDAESRYMTLRLELQWAKSPRCWRGLLLGLHRKTDTKSLAGCGHHSNLTVPRTRLPLPVCKARKSNSAYSRRPLWCDIHSPIQGPMAVSVQGTRPRRCNQWCNISEYTETSLDYNDVSSSFACDWPLEDVSMQVRLIHWVFYSWRYPNDYIAIVHVSALSQPPAPFLYCIRGSRLMPMHRNHFSWPSWAPQTAGRRLRITLFNSKHWLKWSECSRSRCYTTVAECWIYCSNLKPGAHQAGIRMSE